MGGISALLGFVLVGFVFGWFVAERNGAPVVATQTTAQKVLPAAPVASATAPAAAIPGAPAEPAFVAAAAPGAPAAAPNPLFGPNFKPNDGLPVYVCGIEASPSYLNLIYMQMSGADIAHGFHLGIVPIELDQAPYEIDEDGMCGYMQRGAWDCIIEEIDEVMIGDYGIVTALVDESLGENGIWGRGIPTYYDLADKRIAFEEKSSAHFFLLYVLSILPPEARASISLLPFRTDDAALAAFVEGRADAVSGVGESLSATSSYGGQHIISSNQLRVIANALITSRKAVREKPQLVQAFHAAWFDALKTHVDDYDVAAQRIAAWGHTEWTHVPTIGSTLAYVGGFKNLAQADLRDNLNIMRNIGPILDRLDLSRQLWSDAGRQVVADPVGELVDPRFVLGLLDPPALLPDSDPINDGFTLATAGRGFAASMTAAATATRGDGSVVVLPCKRFEFAPDSARLTPASRETIDRCVVPALKQRAGLSLRVTGSAAWPGPKGKFSEANIRAFGRERTQAIADYLTAQGVDPSRLIVVETLPPPERRESLKATVLALDRFVEMALVTTP